MGAVAANIEDRLIGEINTTPLIDVMLVLLIMFIITIPLQTHSVPIDLPAAAPSEHINPDRNKIAIDQAGTVFWNGAPIGLDELDATLNRVAAMSPPPELQVEPHAEARYERVDEVLAVIRGAKVTAMGIVGNERYAIF